MEVIAGSEVFEEYVTEKLHEETQVEGASVSLTAGAIHELGGPGDLDFGGSEFKLAERSPIEPEKRNNDDDYGWWSLSAGNYILELNESIVLPEGLLGVLHPHDHLNWNGAQHSTIWLSPDDSDMKLMLSLSVGSNGINIKENARVTTLRVFRKTNSS